MENKSRALDIEENITKYLFLQLPCFNCGEVSALSLYMMDRQIELECPKCHKKISFQLLDKEIRNLALSFDHIHELLQKAGLRLTFLYEPYATLWHRESISPDNT